MDDDKDEQARDEIRRKLQHSQDELIGDAAKPVEEQDKEAEGERGAAPPPVR
jgi:hypothetical protein